MQVRVADVLAAVGDATLVGPRDATVTGVAYDSRRVEPGDLFAALPGLHVDGHRFIDAAIARGASAVLCERAPDGEPPVPHIVVPDARRAMADAAAAVYGYPSAQLGVIGVTGTDGKTTTSFLLHALLQSIGQRAGLISTVAFRVGERAIENTLHQTTPEAPDIQRLLAAMVADGCRYAVVESSSHGLVLHRLRGCLFDAGIFTNLTSDHLDFHGTVEEYRAAKALLFRQLGQHSKPGIRPVAILNRDDPSFDFMRAASTAPVLSYGLHADADVRARAVEATAAGMRFRAVTPRGEVAITSPLIGRFNVSNLLAALAFAVAQDFDLDAVAQVLSTFSGVRGRMQRLDAGQPFTVVIDFAHTPDSLAKVLDELRAGTSGRLIAVFGAAGERDRGKRSLMGRIAAERCDLIILADEDPRSEDPRAIVEEIAAGARAAGAREGERLVIEPDRRAAIELAMQRARPGDTVLLAGKGHEDAITYGARRLPWNEEAVARSALAAVREGVS